MNETGCNFQAQTRAKLINCEADTQCSEGAVAFNVSVRLVQPRRVQARATAALSTGKRVRRGGKSSRQAERVHSLLI